MRLVGFVIGIAFCLPVQPASGQEREGAATSSDSQGVRFFESRIRPLLARHCYECHGPDKQEGSLRLDTLKGILSGGDSGMVVQSGKPNASLLVTAVTYQDQSLQMPPENRLSKQEVSDLRKWIDSGLPHPDSDSMPVQSRTESAKSEQGPLWSFQAPGRIEVPEPDHTNWSISPLDQFIYSGLQRHGLKPAAPADRLTLLRRTSLTLTGLPPSPEVAREFLDDTSPSALAKLVERLLGSPEYGERWGRHWLDVARYADSNGLDENIHHGNAWRYRDYVVNSLNADKSYAEFVTEQLAGDLLKAANDADRYQKLIATGFLAIGPKVLAEVDETKMEMDIIDEQLDTVGRSIMGLTLGCARCHDHKFDPISTEDYYALAGIFKSTRTMEHYTKIARWWENPIPSEEDRQRTADHEQQLAESRHQIDELVKATRRDLLATRENAAAESEIPESDFPDEVIAKLKKLRDALAAAEKSPPEVATAMGVLERDVKDLPIHIRGSHLTLGDVVPRGFPKRLRQPGDPGLRPDQSGRLELARWLTSGHHPLTARVLVNRVWRWHFGQGLVATPDNFGVIGDRPINRELLDWLAVEFIRNDWSLKWLHRTILLSSTWQMSSQSDPAAESVDPQNRLQWRANMRRLEAEAIRDSILAVTGQLDSKLGGSLVSLGNREFFFNHTSKDETDYNSNRRSIYLPVVRNHLYEVFSLFDYSDAGSVVGHRTTSTVAPQALFLLNSEFILTASRRLAQSLIDSSSDPGDRIRNAYQRVLFRSPDREELDEALRFVNANDDTPAEELPTWSMLCQALLTSNEFLYVR